MFTTQERLELKAMVLKACHELILNLAQKNYDKEKLKEIISFSSENLANAQRMDTIEKQLKELSEMEITFTKVLKKFQSHKNEIIQQIGEECMENLMESDSDRWMQLMDDVNQLNEESFKKWASKLSLTEVKLLHRHLKQRQT